MLPWVRTNASNKARRVISLPSHSGALSLVVMMLCEEVLATKVVTFELLGVDAAACKSCREYYPSVGQVPRSNDRGLRSTVLLTYGAFNSSHQGLSPCTESKRIA